MDSSNKFRLSYSRRLFLWLVGYLLVVVGCFVVFQYHREKEFKQEELNARLQGINSEILNDIADMPYNARHLSRYKDLRVSIIDTTGRVIYDNTLDATTARNHLSRKEIKEALETGTGYTVRRNSQSTGSAYFYSATLGQNGYIVRTAVPYSVTLSSFLKADMTFLWVIGAIVLTMCALGYFATRRLGLIILRLNRFAERAERGERIYDTTPFPHDELGSISNHIVKLYADLQQATAERDKEHRRTLFEQREKERIKKQLTNNINHELKTPVASIHVCLEILLSHNDLSDDKRQEFLQRCMTNTERLRHLLEDVSLITRMDDAPASIEKDSQDLTGIIAEVVADCEPIADSKGMVIINGITQPISIRGNQSLLASIFRNLIDNAIAYSGGNKVELRLLSSSNPKQVVIALADNGSGVPPEHLPRIFERFYRIDKGRSRAAGGTGLGLSIVKNAVLLHHGTITAENCATGGLMFTIAFRKSD